MLTSSVYHAGDYDATLPGSYGDNIATSESSRELIALLQKLIKVISENGPISAVELAPLIGGTTLGVIGEASGARPMPVGAERQYAGANITTGK